MHARGGNDEMMDPKYILYTLLLIIIMYVFAHIIRVFIAFVLKSKFDFCPKCFSIFGTWIFLSFYVFIFKNEFPIEIIILLIGGSVTGIAYALDDYIKKRRAEKQKFIFQDFFIQFIMTLIGLIFIYLIF